MKTQDSINCRQAIAEMRKLTTAKIPFSFSHATYNRDNQTGGEEVFVKAGLLRKALPDKAFKEVDPDLLLPYLDDNEQPKMCYKLLLLSFNGMQITFDEP